MYIDEKNLAEHQKLYWQLVHDVLEASPSMGPFLTDISERIADGKFYQALKVARKLIAYEGELIRHAAARS
jgi:flagellar protein FlbT